MREVEIDRTLTHRVHKILERNRGSLDLILIRIRNRGVPLAHRIGRKLHQIEGIEIPVGSVDVTLCRDDFSRRIPLNKPRKSDIPFIVTDKKVVLVDDVLQAGRTVRAPRDALIDFGRPLLVSLAVLVHRGQRELPIQADFVGREAMTLAQEKLVKVRLSEVDAEDQVVIEERANGA